MSGEAGAVPRHSLDCPLNGRSVHDGPVLFPIGSAYARRLKYGHCRRVRTPLRVGIRRLAKATVGFPCGILFLRTGPGSVLPWTAVSGLTAAGVYPAAPHFIVARHPARRYRPRAAIQHERGRAFLAKDVISQHEHPPPSPSRRRVGSLPYSAVPPIRLFLLTGKPRAGPRRLFSPALTERCVHAAFHRFQARQPVLQGRVSGE